MKVEGDDMFRLVLFNREGSEIFMSTCDDGLIYIKSNFHVKASGEAYWKNVVDIPNVRSILSDWSAFNFDFGGNHGLVRTFDLSQTGKTLVRCFTENICVYNFVHGNWEKHFLDC